MLSFPGFDNCIVIKVISFSELSNLFQLLLPKLSHFSTLLMTIYQKLHCVNILLKYYWSSLQYCCNLVMEEFAKKYCGI